MLAGRCEAEAGVRWQIFIRNRLKYALTGREVTLIVKQRLVKIDNKVRTDETYPAGFMGQSRSPRSLAPLAPGPC